jgi:acyl-CoA synthetase (AMP-forming)/AMP-acid ligase II
VSFLDKNHPACVEISMAAGSLGAANAIVNWRSSGDEVDYAVNDCGAKVLFVGSELMPTVAKHRTAVADGHPDWLVSAGRPIPGVEVRIVDPDSLSELPVGEHGEVWLKTKQLMKGFLGKPEETAAVITDDGWFRTGDMGKVDSEGFVFVQDRLKDMIISGGENIYSPEVERVLAEHPVVAECAVIGVPDDIWGETVKAVVALKPDTSATDDEIIDYCREHLAHFKCPTSVDIIEALPRNPTGKILKKDLRQPYWEGRDRAVN